MPTGAEHNCQDFQAQLQRALDTPPPNPLPEAERGSRLGPVSRPCPTPDRRSPPGKPGDLRSRQGHGQETAPQQGGSAPSCPTCRELYAAAGLLRRGLGLLAPPPVPTGLAARVVGAVLADRRRRQRRRFRLAGALALAASVAVIVLADRLVPPPVREKSPGGPDVAEVPSIRETVTGAGSAVAGLTARAVDRTRQMLPVVDKSLLPPMDLQPPLEPPGRSLLEAGQGISAGLEPIADSAWRAFALFRRELPPLGPDKKPEL